MLVIGMLAQLFTSALQFGLPFVLPQFISLADDSSTLGVLLVSAPNAGLIATLLAWGWFTDRFGERITMLIGLFSGALVLCILVVILMQHQAPPFLLVWGLLFLSSALLAAVNSASGRLILAWFPLRERGLAMGIRQTSQPLGVALSAALFPSAALVFGLHAAFGIVGAGCTLAAVLILFAVPAEPPHFLHPAVLQSPLARAGSPYAHATIWRTHGASALLTVGQFVFSVFGFSYLVSHLGWDPVPAGLFFSIANLLASGMRVLLGWASDRLRSRLRPLRAVSYWLAGLALLLFALHEIGALGRHAPALPLAALLFASTVLSASNNGLSYTLVAEYAGSRWTGRALGVQNTVQNLIAVAVPPLGMACIGLTGIGSLFFVSALGAGAAAALLPPQSRDS